MTSSQLSKKYSISEDKYDFFLSLMTTIDILEDEENSPTDRIDRFFELYTAY